MFQVGSGKSSLLHSILGEMRLIQGLIISQGSIAYVPQVSLSLLNKKNKNFSTLDAHACFVILQVPWIQSGSVRDNILFGDNFDTKR